MDRSYSDTVCPVYMSGRLTCFMSDGQDGSGCTVFEMAEHPSDLGQS